MTRKAFKKKFQGYDPKEVDQRIKVLDAEITKLTKKNEEALNENVELYSKVEGLNKVIKTMDDKYEELNSEFDNFKQSMNDVRQQTLSDTNKIIVAAKNNANDIVKEALITAKIMLIEVARISDDVGDLKTEINEKINEISYILDSIELPTPPNTAWLKEI